MADSSVRFNDGASYDIMMGAWSQDVGKLFLDWLSPYPDLDWLDVGCGSGAFTSLIVERTAPKSVVGIDPSEAQLDYARSRLLNAKVRFAPGSAMRLEFADSSIDMVIAALVVHFMPDPTNGVVEMARVARTGGTVAAYAWDLAGGGFPYHAIHEAMRSIGLQVPAPPHPEVADVRNLERLWTSAGLVDIAQREFSVTRTFPDFAGYWKVAITAPRIAAVLQDLSPTDHRRVRDAAQNMLPSASDGSVAPTARANAIRGRSPMR